MSCLFFQNVVHNIDPCVVRTFSGLCGLGVLAGATMVPVTTETSLQGKMTSEASLNNNRGQGNSATRKPNRVLRLLLGQDLASSNRLSHYFLFVFTDFLCFTSVYIPYTHLPNFAQVMNCSYMFLHQFLSINLSVSRAKG